MSALMMKLAIPVSPYPTFPRKRDKGQTRKAIFTLMLAFACQQILHFHADFRDAAETGTQLAIAKVF